MAARIRTVGVLGAGVIGASWAALFLSKGLKVILSDPAPGSKESFEAYLETAWTTLKTLGLPPSACKTNYEMVDSVLPFLNQIDFIQEVCRLHRVRSKRLRANVSGIPEWP
jgi:3-hydroxyacyl-CoA dehydrogenase